MTHQYFICCGTEAEWQAYSKHLEGRGWKIQQQIPVSILHGIKCVRGVLMTKGPGRVDFLRLVLT